MLQYTDDINFEIANLKILKLLFFYLSFRLIPKKLMSSYAGMEECEKNKHNHYEKNVKITCK